MAWKEAWKRRWYLVLPSWDVEGKEQLPGSKSLGRAQVSVETSGKVESQAGPEEEGHSVRQALPSAFTSPISSPHHSPGRRELLSPFLQKFQKAPTSQRRRASQRQREDCL